MILLLTQGPFRRRCTRPNMNVATIQQAGWSQRHSPTWFRLVIDPAGWRAPYADAYVPERLDDVEQRHREVDDDGGHGQEGAHHGGA